MAQSVGGRSLLPEAFLDRLQRILPEDRIEAVLASYTAEHSAAFRSNALKTTPEAVESALRELAIPFHPLGWKRDAWWVDAEHRRALLDSRLWTDHLIYVQNPSSMIPPEVLAPQPGERVLDLAAAPGSKTLQIAGMMHDEGEIAAVELVRSRFFKLREQLSAYGARSVRPFLKNGEDVWRNRPEYFDRVLLDAPCSTEGRFDPSDPDSIAYWSPRKIKEMAGKQQRLLFSAIQCLRPGGTLVYSTCTFAPEENEAVVSRMLRRFGDAVTTVPITLEVPELGEPLIEWGNKAFDPRLTQARRVIPDALMEAFFVCKLTKLESTLSP